MAQHLINEHDQSILNEGLKADTFAQDDKKYSEIYGGQGCFTRWRRDK